MKNCLFFSLFVLSIANGAPAFARDALGSGYFCESGSIFKGATSQKVVKLSKAKSAIGEKISALGNSKRDKAKKSSLKAVKASLSACAAGTFGVGSSTPSTGRPNKQDRPDGKPCHGIRCRF